MTLFNLSRHVYLTVTKGKAKATELTTGKSAELEMLSSTHPRSIMGGFVQTEEVFTRIVSIVCPRKFLSIAPIIYVHLIDDVEGGYTDVEIRAFREAAYGAGAREVFLPKSKMPLSKQQIINREFQCWD